MIPRDWPREALLLERFAFDLSSSEASGAQAKRIACRESEFQWLVLVQWINAAFGFEGIPSIGSQIPSGEVAQAHDGDVRSCVQIPSWVASGLIPAVGLKPPSPRKMLPCERGRARQSASLHEQPRKEVGPIILNRLRKPVQDQELRQC